MKQQIISLSVLSLLSVTLMACGAPNASTTPVSGTLPTPAEAAAFPADQGWTNPHPGVYLQTIKNTDGTIKSEGYTTTTTEGLQWLARQNQEQIDALKRGTSALALDGDAEIRKSQKIRSLEAVVTAAKNVSADAAPQSITAQAACVATGYALPTGPTPGAKAYARAGECTPTSWSVMAQATNAQGQSPIDSANTPPTNIPTVTASRVVYVYGSRNCYSTYSAQAGTLTSGNSNYSCY